MKHLSVLVILFSCFIGHSQILPTPPSKVKSALLQKQAMETGSILKNWPLKNIGPTIMSGRVVDLDVNPENPVEFYVAYASGGLWYTNNNGTSFTPVMDNAPTQNIGDIAVHWPSGTLWVGTGENNASRSSYAGIGLLKSTDQGKTWSHMGLIDSHHIGRIVINPDNPEEVVVGAMGHLYTANEERGIFKTTDGGQTWHRTLFINSDTGIIDIAHAPENFKVMYAAAWEKDRKAWDFLGSGYGSGIYKSTDGGNSWSKISNAGSGFPTGYGTGRIGLAVFDENIVYALLDNQDHREASEEKTKDPDVLTASDFKSMTKEDFLGLDDKKLNNFLKKNGFQEKYRSENVKQMIRSNLVEPADLAQYLEDANTMLFDTPVIGAEVYRSDNGGHSWAKQNTNYIDALFYSYGYYFGEIRVDPNDADKIYVGGVPLLKSADGGKTFTSINRENVHVDHHALWVDPKMPGHLINGNDGGVNISYDDGETWIKNNSPAVGQFYAINVDNQEPYHVYGGLQDNGVWEGPHNAKEDRSWHQTGHYPWKSIMGGDGMQIEIDNRDPNTVYTGYQFGNYYRIDLKNDRRKYIQPKRDLGEKPFRFNWQTPILLSPHNQDILYLGSNRLHRSMNQGDDWETLSEDLTQGGKKGNVAYGTLTTISESPLKFGLIYTGSDDGLVHLTQNGGADWKLISHTLPQNRWVSRVLASKHKKERVYLALNGYRQDDFTTYLYKSEDYGNTWKDISGNIPASPVNTIMEDPENENLLFVGTDNGLYTSFDQGASWHAFQNGMPNVAVHDLVIQPRDKHLLVGTHGRSIYKADIAVLQKITPELLAKDLHVFKLDDIEYSKDWGKAPSPWSKPSTPGLDVVFFSKKAQGLSAEIRNEKGIVVSATTIDSDQGLNILSYDLAFSESGKQAYMKKGKQHIEAAKNGKAYLPKGSYTVELKGKGIEVRQEFKIVDTTKK
ncbi:VPS10 domain-containing protein [Pseudozobellia thermophila]|uniref:Sortilin, neurotensin receptor 3 n=1 Tax=Pseudozobellia thermophila TaxID=192903 RepID=A0A1M6BUS5_9FLAO|nr:glycosyl hydrolase [Pseudozobellia thermophila]SHI52490.1 Sortilin, neurotensin receptor 3 [Pseudozobellia thermophila]